MRGGCLGACHTHRHIAVAADSISPACCICCRFRRCTEADHIQQEVLRSEQEMQRVEERRQVVAEVSQCLKEGRPIPEHLLPPPPAAKKEDAKKKAAGGKK